MYFKYWGKAEKDGDGYHLLPYHCLDVAAVGHRLLSMKAALHSKIISATGLDDTVCDRWLELFLAMHDIGKFSETFQNLRPDLLEILQGKTSKKSYSVRHDSLGNLLWRDKLWDTQNGTETPLFPEIDKDLDDWQDVFRIVIAACTGHHGSPPTLQGPNNNRLLYSRFFSDDDSSAVQAFIQDIGSLVSFREEAISLSSPEELEEQIRRGSWLIAGFVVLCDWIGSNRTWFPFQKEPMTLADYWQNFALPGAKSALMESGIGTVKTVSPSMTMKRLFPSIAEPTPLQHHVAACPIANDSQIFIMEDITGSGKTEAALLLAGRLMASGQGDGLFMALPTMATSNAMYERLASVYRTLYSDEAAPSLVLAHAARHLSIPFMESVAGPEKVAADEDAATAQCSAWLADNRKKALLADVGVGTIDQALLAILPARFQSLRLFGLVGHILIVDEVHAYDPYMNKLLQNLLTFHAALGGSAILLSATLPGHVRQQLLAAFARGRVGYETPRTENDGYPLVTTYSRDIGVTETAIDAMPQRCCCVSIKLAEMQNEVESLIVAAARHGKCVCWIRNTVQDALDSYASLKKVIDADNLALFHARFAMGDRLEIERGVTHTFGRKSGAKERRGKVLVATQVVEQSLDLDFDILVSDLAPMDLLIQRAGRLHRHSRDANGNALSDGRDRRESACMVIYGPLPNEDATENWYKSAFNKAAYVYPSHGCLWLTARLLAEKGVLRMPDDARELIEAAFSEHADIIPEPLRQRDEQAEAKWMADKSLAHINMLKLEEGYTATANQWREDMRTPTRLGGLVTTVRLARWDGKSLTPWYPDSDFPWDMSQVSIRSNMVYTEYDKHNASLAAEILRVKESFPDKGKWTILVPMGPQGKNRWQGKALNMRGETVIVEYSPLTGVTFGEKEE
jgi:CRISPR-associated endonuclease/helicase Cas3